MTIEEAIYLLDPATTGQAISEIEYYHGLSGRKAAIQAITEACELACEIMRKYEELLEESGRKNDECAGLEIMLTTAQSAAETWKCRCEAAEKDIASMLARCDCEARHEYCAGCDGKSDDCSKYARWRGLRGENG